MTATDAEHQRQIASLGERLQLQALISDISTLLMSLPSSHMANREDRDSKFEARSFDLRNCPGV
jgi:hypothetical protein